MTAPELRDALTNEVTIKKISVALNALFGIPRVTLKLIKYVEVKPWSEERGAYGNITVELVLRSFEEDLIISIYISGPYQPGQFSWGFNQDDHAMSKSVKEGITHYTVRGYLRPEKK